MKSANPGSDSGSHGGDASPAEERCGETAILRAVDRCREGRDRDESGFRRLYDCFFQPLRKFFARNGVSRPDDCLDLTQDTFLRVYRGLKRFRGNTRAEFAAYLFRIARNTHLKWREKRNRQGAGRQVAIESTEDLDWLISDKPWPLRQEARPPDRRVEQKEREKRLHDAVQELPDKMRRCVLLRLQGLKNHEVAAALRIAPGTVGAHLAQARDKLRGLLENDGDA